jgi:Tfp pilus assembly protein PilE
MQKKNNQGYSLIELLIAIQIFMIIVTMVYTVYLIGYRFILQWNRDNDLARTELLVQKALMSKLHQAKKLIQLNNDSIILLSRWYQLQNIHWDNTNLYVDTMRINPIDIQIQIKNILFLKKDMHNYYRELTFSDLDQNRDSKLTSPELRELNNIKLEIHLSTKTRMRASQLNFTLPPHPNLINTIDFHEVGQ